MVREFKGVADKEGRHRSVARTVSALTLHESGRITAVGKQTHH